MNQTTRRKYLIDYLLNESREYKGMAVPSDETSQRQFLRGLMNVRMPGEIGADFLEVQNEYLKEELAEKGIVTLEEIQFSDESIGIWKGDITRLAVDAIVNAANSGMTGCYVPNHTCIDNCIHTFAGVQLRCECGRIMRIQGYEEPTGKAKLTPGYNLPAKHVLHTVGPIVQGRVTRHDEELLASCYTSCLDLAAENGLESVAFCCISTGVFHFPNQRAAEIAVQTVREYLKKDSSVKKVIFNVFKDMDEQIYRELLEQH
ncbi:MAG: protein-ADP-ribose hydrolase [Eubacteriales bacterium]|nr:protein-ADP-ribose hydrolase [Eubacteriales bacterium]